MARQLTESQIREAKDAFDLFATTSGTDGEMKQKELKIALMTLGFEKVTNEDIRKKLNEIDSSGSTTINFEDFIKLITALLPTRNPREELEEAFKLFDIDGTGRITANNLRTVIDQMGEKLNEQEIVEIIAEAAKTGDQSISLEEFIDLIQDNAIF